MIRTISIVLTVALLFTGLSWFKADWMGGGNLFLVYPGPNFWGHGMPWWYVRCYEGGTCSFLIRYFLYDYLFWLVITSLTAFLIWGIRRLVAANLLRSRH